MVNLMHILVPAYLYPGNCVTNPTAAACAWSPYFTAIQNNKQVMFTMVINPSSGPGTNNSYPDDNWKSVIAQVNSYNNSRTIGYVDSNTNNIPQSTYQPQIEEYLKWRNYASKNLTISGIFVDDMDVGTDPPTPSVPAKYTYYKNFATTIKSSFTTYSRPAPYIVVNPGAPIDCSYYSNVTSVVTFEDYYSNLSNAAFTSSAYSACPRVKQTVIIHDFNGTAADQQQVSDDMGETQRVGNLYITTAIQDNSKNINPYDKFSTLWQQFAAAVTATDSWISAHPQWYPRKF